MGHLADEVERAILVVGAVARPSERFTCSLLMEELRQRFASRPLKRHLPIWENLHSEASVQEHEGWRRIGGFCAGRRCILIFNPQREETAFEFEDGSEITAVIAECFRFEFYVTDDQYSFLICFNHHDFLIAAGQAHAWLIQSTRQSAG